MATRLKAVDHDATVRLCCARTRDIFRRSTYAVDVGTCTGEVAELWELRQAVHGVALPQPKEEVGRIRDDHCRR